MVVFHEWAIIIFRPVEKYFSYYFLAKIYSNISEGKNMNILLKSNDDLGTVP